MLKYRNQPTHKPESLLSTLLAFVQAALVIVGLVGLSVRLFEDNGWLQRWLRSLMRAEFARSATVVAVLLIAGYLLKGWMQTDDEGRQARVADAMLYLMMLVGLYFVYNLFARGEL